MKTIFHRWLVSTCVMLVISSVGWGSGARRAPAAAAHASGFGAGLMVGSINAITGKYVFSNSNAVDFGLGFGLFSSSWTAIYGDYLFNFPGMFGSGTQFGRQSIGYFGVGGGIGFWQERHCWRYYCGTNYASSTSGVFVRGFFGVEWFPGHPPFGIFAEIGPTIGIVPGFGGTIDFGTGARYFF